MQLADQSLTDFTNDDHSKKDNLLSTTVIQTGHDIRLKYHLRYGSRWIVLTVIVNYETRNSEVIEGVEKAKDA